MGCGCSGSTPAAQSGSTARVTRTDLQSQMQDGGPGTPGYTWNGPPRADNATPEPAAAPAD